MGFVRGMQWHVQDAWVQQGVRITPKGDTEVYARRLENGDTAVGLFNKDGPVNGTLVPPCISTAQVLLVT